MTRSEARTETSRQLSNARETLKLAKSQTAKTTAQNKIVYLVAVQKALCEPTKETVERMRGEWIGMTDDDGCTWFECSRCEYGLDSLEEPNHFCPACGAPITDEAVDILWQRLKEALK